MIKEELAKCGKCGKALPCFSIVWSELPDMEKCWCKDPVYPDGPLVILFKRLFKR